MEQFISGQSYLVARPHPTDNESSRCINKIVVLDRLHNSQELYPKMWRAWDSLADRDAYDYYKYGKGLKLPYWVYECQLEPLAPPILFDLQEALANVEV